VTFAHDVSIILGDVADGSIASVLYVRHMSANGLISELASALDRVVIAAWRSIGLADCRSGMPGKLLEKDGGEPVAELSVAA
jgi:hypothetical protein